MEIRKTSSKLGESEKRIWKLWLLNNYGNYSAYIKQHQRPSLQIFNKQISVIWFSLTEGDWLLFSLFISYFSISSFLLESISTDMFW